MTNVKRVYYSFALLMYFVFIRYENVSLWCTSAPMGITPEIWSYLFSMIVALLTAITIDNFVISGYVFKEFGFLGTKFIREDIKKDTEETVKGQSGYILSLENNLQSLYDVPSLIDNMFNSCNIVEDISKYDTYFTKYFNNILRYYYDLKNEVVSIDASFYKHDEIDSIINKYKTEFNDTIDRKNIKDLRKCLLGEIEGKYLKLGDHRLYIITKSINILTESKQLMISIKSLDEINVLDIYPIFNFLYIFILNLDLLHKNNVIVDADFE